MFLNEWKKRNSVCECGCEKVNGAFFKDCEPLTVGSLKKILKHVHNDVVVHAEWRGNPEDYTLVYGAYYRDIDYGGECRPAFVLVNDEEWHCADGENNGQK